MTYISISSVFNANREYEYFVAWKLDGEYEYRENFDDEYEYSENFDGEYEYGK